jgi:hypothetical protein
MTTGRAATLSMEAAQAAAWDWCDAWNRRDLDGVMALYADDVAFNSPAVVKRSGVADGWLHGKGRLRENFAIAMQTPGLRFELFGVLLGVSAMTLIYRRETGALVGDLVEVDDAFKAKRVVACYGVPRT